MVSRWIVRQVGHGGSRSCDGEILSQVRLRGRALSKEHA